jgi:hypothetical protein
VKDGGREWTGRFVNQTHAESRGEGGGGRVSWGLKEAGNSLSRNFGYRAVGPPPGYEGYIMHILQSTGLNINDAQRQKILTQQKD